MASGDVYEKVAGAWVLRSNIATGTQGPAGEKWFSGSGLPSGGLGAQGDWYLDTSGSTGSTLIPTAYGIMLPASPIDGQEAILVDSITNPSYQWRFRYNAGSSSAYKWEFIGGSPGFAAVETLQLGTSTYADLATPGPSMIVPRAGDYDVYLSFYVDAAQLGGWGMGSAVIQAGGVYTTPAINPLMNVYPGQVPYNSTSDQARITCAAGDTIIPKYQGASVGFARRRLRVTPARVS